MSFELFEFKTLRVYVKRDDLLYKYFNGNKARKLHYYLLKDFKDIKYLVSYGGAQSNILVPLITLARFKKVKLIYYLKKIPKFLKQNPIANYKTAKKFGVIFREIAHKDWENFILKLKENKNELLIRQGASQRSAKYGLLVLAKEIKSFIKDKNINKVFLPSGTGTTALYLQKYLDIEVFTSPCVGDNKYLKESFYKLGEKKHPKILSLNKKYTFAKPYKEFLDIYLELKKEGIEFDLIYDPIAWLSILKHKEIFKEDFIYIHCGGNNANISQLKRYEHKGFI